MSSRHPPPFAHEPAARVRRVAAKRRRPAAAVRPRHELPARQEAEQAAVSVPSQSDEKNDFSTPELP
jgi:hypothetical protein